MVTMIETLQQAGARPLGLMERAKWSEPWVEMGTALRDYRSPGAGPPLGALSGKAWIAREGFIPADRRGN